MRPFVLLATRAEEQAAEEEYAAFRRFGGLTGSELVRIRLNEAPLGRLDLERYSGIILGGSPFTASDHADTKSALQVRVESDLAALLDDIVALDFPFLGACYGIGTLGTHQGAVVDKTHPEPVSATVVRLTPEGAGDPLLGVLPEEFEAFVGHKEAIAKLPDHAVSLATSPACPVQAFKVRSNVYATQFHPELDIPGILTRIETYKHHGYFAPEQAEDLKDAARRSHVVHPPLLVRRFVELYAR